MKTYSPITKYVWVLVTDGIPRIAFDSELRAREYMKDDVWRGRLYKVYNGVGMVETELE